MPDSRARPARASGSRARLAPIRFAILFALFLLAQTLSAQAQCALSATTIPFGSADLISGSTVTATGTVSVNCPGGFGNFPFLWLCTSIGVGVNSVSVNNRTMKSGSNTLGYQLYTDSGFTTIYQYTPSNQYSAPYSNSTGGTSNSPVYGKILAGQTSPPGTYTDTYSTAAQAQVAGNVATTLPGTCSGSSSALSVSVTAMVVASCSLSVANLNFGSMSTLASNADTTGSVTITCTNTTPYNIGLGAGTGTGATVAARKMTKGASTLVYSLYKDAPRTTVWGNTIGTNTSAGTAQTSTVYGRAPPQAIPAAGTYSDTVIVTATF
jgi:spore coat protein U domain-containing protein, fimbrial subunit CupE1/2/3/6